MYEIFLISVSYSFTYQLNQKTKRVLPVDYVLCKHEVYLQVDHDFLLPFLKQLCVLLTDLWFLHFALWCHFHHLCHSLRYLFQLHHDYLQNIPNILYQEVNRLLYIKYVTMAFLKTHTINSLTYRLLVSRLIAYKVLLGYAGMRNWSPESDYTGIESRTICVISSQTRVFDKF